MTLTSTDLPVYPPPGADPLDPGPGYVELHARGGISRAVLPDGRPVWLVAGHDEVRQLLVDPRVTTREDAPGYPSDPLPPELQEDAVRYVSLSNMDPPEHTVRRRMLLPDLTVRRVRAMRPLVRRIVDDLITDMLAGDRPADLMSQITMPVSFHAACALLGVPDAERHLFQDTMRVMVESTTIEDLVAATRRYLGYLDELVTAKEEEPADDLIGRFVERNREEGALSHDDVVAMSRLMLGNGPTSAVHAMSYGTLILLRHPDQLAELRANPDLMPAALEEVLRYVSFMSGQVVMRAALADIDIAGVRVRAGDTLIVLCGAANADTRVFAEPERFDIHRGARHHVTFGHGVHQCVAQNLGRVELEELFTALFTRVPGLRLAVPDAEIPFTDGPPFSMASLPVTW